MQQQRKKRRRRRRRIKWGRLAAYIVILVAAIFAIRGAIGLLTKSSGEKETKQGTVADENGQQKDSAEADKATLPSPDKENPADGEPDGQTEPDSSAGTDAEGTDTAGTGTEGADTKPEDTAQPKEEKKPFSLSDLDNPEGFDERPAAQGFTLENQQVDINGLDTTRLDWGQGGDLDEWNRPAGCMQYQEKYGKYNAYFIVDNPEKKVIYLTIDEGYENGYTPQFLDTLKEKNVHAVFFVTQSYARDNPELVQRILDDGHELGNHSVTHPSQGVSSQSIEEQTNEVMGLHSYIKENFGYEMHLFRYPAGIFSEQSAALLNNLNYKSVFWSFAYLDYDVENQPDPAESLQKLVNCLHPGALYLVHAESETNAKILGDFIDQARAQGYEFKLFE